MPRRILGLCVAAMALLASAGCDALKSENPTSPSVAGPIPGVDITAPRLLEPAAGATIRFTDQPITLLFENSQTNGQRTIAFTLEVALDEGFTNRVYARQALEPAAGGRTSVRLPEPLAAERSYYWRVWASDGANTGPISVNTFSVVQVGELKAPSPIAPTGGVTVSSLVPELSTLNAVRSGPIGAVTYTFEIADDEAFTSKVATATAAEQALETRVRVSPALGADGRYFWRVRAYDATTSSPWSAVQWFKTPAPSSPSPSPGPSPGPSNPRTIGIDEALSIIRFIYEDNRYNIGGGSTREERNVYLERAVAALHYGHSRYNPKGPDSTWCLKAVVGRPQSDDVIARCDTREAWDLVGGIGADGYTWGYHYVGVLGSDQVAYKPNAAALEALPR